MKRKIGLIGLILLGSRFAFAVTNVECIARTYALADVAMPLVIPLKAGEKAFTTLFQTGKPNQVALSTTDDRILIIDTTTGKVVEEKKVPRTGRLEFAPGHDWGITYSGPYGHSHFINWKTGEVKGFGHPTGEDYDLEPVGATIHPTKAKALSYAGSGKYPIVEYDIEGWKVKPLLVSDQPLMSAGAYAQYMNKGKETVITLTGDISSRGVAGTGLILNDHGRPTHQFSLPPMDRMNGVPGIKVSPYDRTFVVFSVEGPPYHEKGERKTWVHVFAPSEGNPNQPQNLEHTMRFLVKTPQTGEMLGHYFPPVTFTKDGKILIGNRLGGVDLYNLKKPVQVDDYQSGEHLTTFEKGHDTAPVVTVAASGDGMYFASGAENGTVAIWSADGTSANVKIEKLPSSVSKIQFMEIGGKERLLVHCSPVTLDITETTPSEFFVIDLPAKPQSVPK